MIPPKMQRVLKVGAVPVAIVTGLLVVFILLELLCRVLQVPYPSIEGPGEIPVTRFDKELGWSYIPGLAVQMQFGPPRFVDIYIDDHGIRVPSQGYRLDPAKPSILFIGCSYTMGHALFYEENFVGQIAAIPHMPYQIVNLGVQGYGSDQALLALKRYLPQFNAKLVVYTFVEDHLVRNGNHDRRLVHGGNRFPGTKPLLKWNGKDLVLEKPAVPYTEYRSSRLIDLFLMRVGRMFRFFPPEPVGLTKRIIEEMKRVSESGGAHFMVIDWRWDATDRTDELFKDLPVDVLDTLPTAPSGWAQMRNAADKHPDQRASAYVAWLFLQYLKTHAAGWGM